jgi:hypothetical protein
MKSVLERDKSTLYCILVQGGGGSVVMMGEDKLKMSSHKLCTLRGSGWLVFGIGDACAVQTVPWPPPKGGGGGLCVAWDTRHCGCRHFQNRRKTAH